MYRGSIVYRILTIGLFLLFVIIIFLYSRSKIKNVDYIVENSSDKIQTFLTVIKDDIIDYNQMKFMKNVEKQIGIDIEWLVYTENAWKETKKLLFSSNDLPDAFYGTYTLNYFDMLSLAGQNKVIPIEEYINKKEGNISRLLYKNKKYLDRLYQSDGHIYGVPTIQENKTRATGNLFINKVWLDKLGMGVPKTTDEFINVLKAFKNARDLNGNMLYDEIPISFKFNIGEIFGAFGLVDNEDHWLLDNGKVIFTPINQQYMKAMEFMHRLYIEGLIDKEAFTQDSKGLSAKIVSEPPIVGFFISDTLYKYFGDDENPYTSMAPVKGTIGWQYKGMNSNDPIVSKSAFVITNENDDPNLAFKWIDTMYEEDNIVQCYYGEYEDSISKTIDGDIIFLKRNRETPVSKINVPGRNGAYFIDADIHNKTKFNKIVKESEALDKFYSPFFKGMRMPQVQCSSEEAKRFLALQDKIIMYVEKRYLEWMVMGGIRDEWGDYIKELEEMGVNDMIKMYQDFYTRRVNE